MVVPQETRGEDVLTSCGILHFFYSVCLLFQYKTYFIVISPDTNESSGSYFIKQVSSYQSAAIVLFILPCKLTMCSIVNGGWLYASLPLPLTLPEISSSIRVIIPWSQTIRSVSSKLLSSLEYTFTTSIPLLFVILQEYSKNNNVVNIIFFINTLNLLVLINYLLPDLICFCLPSNFAIFN